MRTTVNVDKAMLQDVQNRLGRFQRKAPNVISSSLNRAMSAVNTSIKKEVRQDYIIKAGDVSETLRKVKSSPSTLRAEVISSGAPIGLEKFKVSPKTVNPRRKSPIKTGVKKNGLTKVMGAFVADINGAKVFERTSSSRLPIKRLFGPSVPQMLDNENVTEAVEKRGHEVFNERLEHRINRILSK